jgi:hypothetical protein
MINANLKENFYKNKYKLGNRFDLLPNLYLKPLA